MTSFDPTTHDDLERSIADVDLAAIAAERRARAAARKLPRAYTPSPEAWEDQVLYFLMLDRFSDGQERDYVDNHGARVTIGNTPSFTPASAYGAAPGAWMASGSAWCGGTLAGARTKLGYLRRMGVTAVWVSPIFRQVQNVFDRWNGRSTPANSYHGYGIQNFLDVEPHFGTRQDLRDFVDEAHRLGLRVILDVVFNHAGDVFEYAPDRYAVGKDGKPLGNYPSGDPVLDARWDGREYAVRGYRRDAGDARPDLPLDGPHPGAWPDSAVWPSELQATATFTRRGRIDSWDYDPEFLEGDFSSLKDIHHGEHQRDGAGKKIEDKFAASRALRTLCDAYKFWIAFADVDGFRIDTVKHMDIGATRYFVSVVDEFAQSLGKERFLLVGEVTGGRDRACATVQKTGLSAALGIDDVGDKLEFLAKGYREPEQYFGLFRNSITVGQDSHTWFGRHIVTMLDDHDRVSRGSKVRFCGDRTNSGERYLVPALGLNLLTAGIPCIYYGTEQAFDSGWDRARIQQAMGWSDEKTDDYQNKADLKLRECMFGGPFGSFLSTGEHFFDEAAQGYKTIQALTALKGKHFALRRGRQYLREISGTGRADEFGYPRMMGGVLRSVIAWSRMFADEELLVAVSTDAQNDLTVWVTIDADVHPTTGATLSRLHSTKPAVTPASLPISDLGGRRVVQLTVPAAGVVVYG